MATAFMGQVMAMPHNADAAFVKLDTRWEAFRDRFDGSYPQYKLIMRGPLPPEINSPWTHHRCQKEDIEEDDAEAMNARIDLNQWELQFMCICDEVGRIKNLPLNRHIPGLFGDCFIECVAVNNFTGDCLAVDLDPNNPLMKETLDKAIEVAKRVYGQSAKLFHHSNV